jgi:geranylgeranyl diphosphate synthase type I
MSDGQQTSVIGGRRTAMPPSLVRHRALIDDQLRAGVERLSPTIGRAVAYHFGWCDADGIAVAGDGGKAIRPALTLLAAEACGAPAEAAVTGAVALEFVHDFSLIHDDLMDGDTERRHRPTVWAVFGAGQAIVAGDALQTLAQQLLLEDARPQSRAAALELCRATAAMMEGQAQDLAFEARLDVTVDEGLAMCRLKTGALLACAGAMGAIFAEMDDAGVAALRAFGSDVGVAFQAVDDVLGIWGEPDVTGKPMANDLRQRKKTLPILHALEAASPHRRELAQLLENGELHDERLERAVGLLEESGSREWTLALAERHLKGALAHLEGQSLGRGPAEDLRDAAHFIVHREF